MKTLKLFFISVFFISCGNENYDLKISKVKRLKSINQLKDSTYISDIRSISSYKDKIYITDYKRNQVITLDENLNLINTFGNGGKGPGEFLGAYTMTFSEDKVYVMNDGKKSIEVFEKGNYLKTIISPVGVKFSSQKKFVRNKQNFFISSVNDISSIVKFDNDKTFLFGNLKKYSSRKDQIIKNGSHILEYNDKIISVLDKRPEIDVYSFEGKFLFKYDYSKLKIINDLFDFIKSKNLGNNAYYQIVPDVCLFQNKLYLLILSKGKNNINSNKIIELKILEDKIVPNQIFNLGRGWYENFCIYKNMFIGFESVSGELVKCNLY